MAKICFKEVRDYISKTHNKEYNQEFKSLQKRRFFKIIGDIAKGPSFYKYFPMDTAIKCLENESIAVVEPSRWNDAYESLYYEADYSQVSTKYNTHPRVFATCVTNKKYDEPAWRIYSGDDNVCVQFELDRPKFRLALLKALKDKDSIYEGEVQYASKGTIESICKRQKKNSSGILIDNGFYFDFIGHGGAPFSIDNYLNLLLVKRTDFTHEQETRFFIIKYEDLNKKEGKAKEEKHEVSDATKRNFIVNRGAVEVLKNIHWIDILKSITINVKDDSYQYKLLENTVNAIIDKNVKDPTKNANYRKKLKPISYLVYGTTPAKVTIDR